MSKDRNDLRACWFRLRTKGIQRWIVEKPRGGRLHMFTTDHIEYESGPGLFPVAIVVDDIAEARWDAHAEPVERHVDGLLLLLRYYQPGDYARASIAVLDQQPTKGA